MHRRQAFMSLGLAGCRGCTCWKPIRCQITPINMGMCEERKSCGMLLCCSVWGLSVNQGGKRPIW